MLKNSILLLCFILLKHCSFSQSSVVFNKFILISYSYSAGKQINSSDSFVTKKYTLINQKRDTLNLFQKLPFSIINGEIKIYEIGLTENFVYLKKNSCYDIKFVLDINNFLNDPEYQKHRRIDFLFKKNDGNSKNTFSKKNKLIIFSIRPHKYIQTN